MDPVATFSVFKTIDEKKILSSKRSLAVKNLESSLFTQI